MEGHKNQAGNCSQKQLIKPKTDLERWEELSAEYISYLDRVGDHFDFLRFKLLTPELLNLIGKVRNKRLIDAGCGEGYLSRCLAKEGAFVIGIDAAKSMIKEAIEKEKKDNLDIRYILWDITSPIPLQTGAVDLIIANMTLFSIMNVETAITNLSSFLKSNGEFIFSILHPCFHFSFNQWESMHQLNKANSLWSFHVDRSYQDEAVVERPYIDTTSKISIYLRSIEFYFRIFFKLNYVLSDFREPVIRLDEISEGDRYYHAHLIPRFILAKFKKL